MRFVFFNLFTGTKIRPSAKFVHSYVIFAQSCKCCMQTGLKSFFIFSYSPEIVTQEVKIPTEL